MITNSFKKTIGLIILLVCILTYVTANYFIKNDLRYISFLFFLILLIFTKYSSIHKIFYLWYFNLFYLFLFIGAIYSKFFIGNQYTFFPHLITFSIFYISFIYFNSFSKNDLLEFIKLYYKILFCGFFFFILVLILNNQYNFFYSGFQSHYSLFGIVLLVPGIKRVHRFFLIIIAILSLLLIKKNSAILLLFFWLLFYLYQSTNEIIKRSTIFIYIILFFLILNNFYTIVDFKENLLPQFSTGNIYTRTIMYNSSIEKFFNAPIFGNIFTDSPLIDFYFYSGRDITDAGYVAVHNDVLEILSNGGLFFLFLFVLIVIKPYYFYNKIPPFFKMHFKILYFSFLLFIFSSLFNPIFSLPVLSLMGFLNLGLVYTIYYKSK